MEAVLPALRPVNSAVKKAIEVGVKKGVKVVKLQENVQKELGEWEDFLRLVVQIITEKNNATKKKSFSKKLFKDRHYTVLDVIFFPTDIGTLYRIVSHTSHMKSTKSIRPELRRFYYLWRHTECITDFIEETFLPMENEDGVKLNNGN